MIMSKVIAAIAVTGTLIAAIAAFARRFPSI